MFERDEHVVARDRAGRRRALLLGVIAAMGVGAALAYGPVRDRLRGPEQFADAWVADAPAPSIHQGVDLRAVHEDLIPQWIIALDGAAGLATTHEAAIRDAVAGEPALVAALDGLVAASTDEDPERWHSAAVVWTGVLEELDLPWRVESGTRGRIRYLRTYEVVRDVEVSVDGADVPVPMLRRADPLNVHEARLGHATEIDDRGFVLVDRVAEEAVQLLWPLLDPDAPSDLAPHRAAVRAALAATLEPADLAVLEETAPHRSALSTMQGDVQARGKCSRYRLRPAPWPGYRPADLDAFDVQAKRTRHERCPTIKLSEAKAAREASEALAHTAGLDRAVAALTGALARAVAAHEARHVQDRALEGTPVMREASAYAASFAMPELGALALAQACGVRQGPHRRAVVELGVDCAEPPDDRVAWALGLGATWGHTAAPVVRDPEGLRIPLPPVE